MWHNDLTVTRSDARRLRSFLGGPARLTPAARGLHERLGRAQVVEPRAVPADVVTMHSTVRISDPAAGRPEVLTLVYPTEADAAAGLLSVLSPLGSALLGSRAGDLIAIQGATDAWMVRIEQVLYQPEAAGDEPAGAPDWDQTCKES